MQLQIETVQILTALVFMQQSKYLYLSNFFTVKRGIKFNHQSLLQFLQLLSRSALILIDLLAWALTFAIYFFLFIQKFRFFRKTGEMFLTGNIIYLLVIECSYCIYVHHTYIDAIHRVHPIFQRRNHFQQLQCNGKFSRIEQIVLRVFLGKLGIIFKSREETRFKTMFSEF